MALSPVNLVGEVTQMLETLLEPLTPSLESPADLTLGNDQTGRINVYLYQVLECPYGKNRIAGTRPNGHREYPPLSLKLYYLLTPYAVDQVTAHHVLGDAMRILYDQTIVRGSRLPASLRLTVEQLAISLLPMQLEDLTRVWSALQSAYQLSVAYEVRVVLLQSERVDTPTRVLTKTDHYAQT